METILDIGMNIPKPSREFKGRSLLELVDEYIAIDLETTGLDPRYNDIIEIAAVKMQNGEEIDRFQSLIKIDYPLDPFISELTGITDQILEGAPTIESVLPPFIEFIGDSIVVGHNVHFDINFLYDNAERILHLPVKNNFIDTMRISRRVFKDFPKHNLLTLVHEFGIASSVEHRALSDCIQTAACYEYMKRYITENKISLSNKRSYNSLSESIKAQTDVFDESSPFFGQVFAFTGTLEKMPRRDAMQLVANLGGICGDGVTAKTNFLVLGNLDFCKSIKGGKSSKQKKAEQLHLKGNDITIISENVFYDMLDSCEIKTTAET